ncbi:hypothetical protein A1O1_08296 [Capronia coronata CBS 617.96]|uniref:Zn(2)-C6 fungal-type domain-containing protein n=1 Tax=Capronia coronata CBS 617.96 TaxID=1182541 RepID=W9YCU4_9EURO|nr:uncharacterized protein A1O1_08296 [Capronia coronata CBS 617.96]EXJ80154.1 hypothetical protein A1O1_08296 [Capronia coronata CBS 617.96]
MEQGDRVKKRIQRERVRVTRACDLCKRRKLRCTGTKPCSLCVQSGRECEYTADYHRGKVPSIRHLSEHEGIDGRTSSHHVETNNRSREAEDTHNPDYFHITPENQQSYADAQSGLEDSGGPAGANMNNRTPQRPRPTPPQTVGDNGTFSLDRDFRIETHDLARSSRNSPEPAQTDLEGHYVGPSSGVSFLLRALKKLHENVSRTSQTQNSSSIFSFGDAPLPRYDPYFLVLPTRQEARVLVRRYFDFAFPTHRFLHQQTVEMWLEGFYDSIQHPKPLGSGEREIRAVLLMVLAQVKQYTAAGDESSSNAIDSAAYFGASEHHLASETGGIRLTSIQARLSQCFYLLSQSRINHAWSLFGSVARLASAIGLHRRKRRDMASGVDMIEQECKKRVFWSAYSLDNYLSAALGRPRSFHDEDIDQELPACANDSEITRSKILPPPTNAQSIMLAPVCHAKLSKIISGILRDLYGIKKMSLEALVEAVARYDGRLTEWRSEISGFLDLPNADLMVVVYQRQYTVLNLAYCHAVILLHRPFLLRRSASSSSVGVGQMESLQTKINSSIQKCLQAACKIISILRELTEKNRMYHAFWFTHYYVFSAIVILYVYVIQNHSKAADVWKPYLELGQQGQRDLSACGTGVSFAQRYVVVLSELQNEAQRLIHKEPRWNRWTNRPRSEKRVVPSDQPASTDRPALQGNTPLTPDIVQPRGHGQQQGLVDDFPLPRTGDQDAEYNVLQQSTTPSFLTDLTDWAEFDSLAMAGLGELELLWSTERLDTVASQAGALEPAMDWSGMPLRPNQC